MYEKSLGKRDCIVTVNELLVNKFKKIQFKCRINSNYPVLKDEEFVKEQVDKPTFYICRWILRKIRNCI